MKTAYGSEGDVKMVVRSLVRDMAPSPREDVDGNTHLMGDLGFHSLALMELAFALEEQFSLPPIDEATATGITTVGDIEDHILSRIARADGPKPSPKD